jgi:endonuclease/exonuclease/phosphatase family metal-dependent hydrolase
MGSRGWYARYDPDTSRVELKALTWNLFHGRDFPPDPALFTWRSRILGSSERNETHLQVNRELLAEFQSLLVEAAWDVAILQECPPRWVEALVDATGAVAQAAPTARNWIPFLQRFCARRNPDLLGSWEGGCNLTLVRGDAAASGIVEERTLVVRERLPERRVMAWLRLGSGICVANLHATTGAGGASEDVIRAASQAARWSPGPLLFGGDLNVRPGETGVYEELDADFRLRGALAGSIDQLLARDLELRSAPRAWAPGEREVRAEELAIRLSDHAPVEASFTLAEG